MHVTQTSPPIADHNVADLPDFALLTDGSYLTGQRGFPVRGGSLATLTARIAAAFDSDPATQVIAGAIPFDREAEDRLFQARQWSSGARKPPFLAGLAQDGPLAGITHSMIEMPSAAAYAAAVRRAVELMSRHDAAVLRKVVLARSLELRTDRPIDPHQLLSRLALDSSVASFIVPLSRNDTASRWLVGATPELLVAKRGASVESFPLAGSTPRQPQADADRTAAQALLRSDKDLREHRSVVEAILDALTPYCRQLAVPTAPVPRPTASMWHLGTRIVGVLKDEATPATDLLAVLHPTPAVCGEPRDAAREAIRLLEPLDRGFYAGAVGWASNTGDGEWYVTIRCAELEPTCMRLYAGAGIMPRSDADSETHETAAKFIALIDALGIERAKIMRESPP